MSENIVRYHYVALLGLPGSGKDAAADIISKELGFYQIRMSEVLSSYLSELGVTPTRESLREYGIRLRKEKGPHIVAELTYHRIIKEKAPGFVINGIRNIEEVDFFREKFGSDFISIAIYSPRKLRYLRLVQRNRSGFDRRDYSSFLRDDRIEVELFGLGNAIALADELVVNDGSLEDLKKSLLKILLI
jgi:dephospho-CoA kinase